MPNRMAKGEVVPKSVTGMLKRIITTTNDPMRTPNWNWSKAWAANLKMGREIKGIRPMLNPAQSRILKNVRNSGDRSAQTPPIKYPRVR